MFKLVNPKHKDLASAHNDSVSLKLLICWIEIRKQCVSLFLIRQNLYVIDFHCDLPNDDKHKQVKVTEVYLLCIFCKKNMKLLVVNTERKL